MKIIETDNSNKSIYLPNNDLILLDKEYYDIIKFGKFMKSDYEIVLDQDESYQGFLQFFNDYLISEYYDNHIIIDSQININKYVTAKRFNKTSIYKNILPNANNYSYAAQLMENYIHPDSIVFEEIYQKLFEYMYPHKLYKYKKKYNSVNNVKFPNKSFVIRTNTEYDVFTLSTFGLLIDAQKHNKYKIDLIDNETWQITIKDTDKKWEISCKYKKIIFYAASDHNNAKYESLFEVLE